MIVEGRDISAAILDLDGVVTDTAALHARAWKRAFDEFQDRYADSNSLSTRFSIESDYPRYVDGKPRYDGVRSFLESRKIELPLGKPDDPPGTDTICGLGNLKNSFYLELLNQEGPNVYEDAVDEIERWRNRGVKLAIVSSSLNCEIVLEKAKIRNLFDVVIGGRELERAHINGKPAPDAFLAAARRLGVDPSESLVVEDSPAGVRAARNGDFALVVGLDSKGIAPSLKASGADIVVSRLDQIIEVETTEWKLIYNRWDPDRQRAREALCALGNGYIVTRGAFSEVSADKSNYPGCYLAGGYDRAESEVAGRLEVHEDLVNWPNWLCLTFRVGREDWFDLSRVTIHEFKQELDLKEGCLIRLIEFEDKSGRRSRLHERRFVHIAEAHLAGIEWTLTPLNWSGRIKIRSGIDGGVVNGNVERYRALNNNHIRVTEMGQVGDSCIYLVAKTNQSRLEMAQAVRTEAFLEGEPASASRRTIRTRHSIFHELVLDCVKQKDLSVEKIAAIYTSRDRAITEPTSECQSAVLKAERFGPLFRKHSETWSTLWNRCDIRVQQSSWTQAILRFHVFQILQTSSPNSIDVDAGIPARGWHGEAYRGHIFWDELFVIPFLYLRMPELGRELLLYRYRRLGQARRHALELGFEGAMYPWQSGSNGREESPTLHLNPNTGEWQPDLSSMQRHVGAAIVYNIWQYYQATHDVEFLYSYGAKVVFEISRFFASLTTYNSAKHRYEILHVVGPDEFHTGYPWRRGQGIDNNAYTNIMVSWTLSHALALFDLIGARRRRELVVELSITDEERHRWRDISNRMFVPFMSDGIIAQFEGYERLKELDWKAYQQKYGDLQRLDRILDAENDSTDNYQVAKQADVTMLFYLFSTEELTEIFGRLGYSFSPESIPRNIEHYASRVSHGSTLSRIVHAWVLARLDRPRAWHLFKEALQSDVSDIQGGTTAEGIHLGAMAGTVDIIERCFTGLEMRNEVLWLNPNLPADLPALELRMRYGGHWLNVAVDHERLRVDFEESWIGPVKIAYGSEIVEMRPGESHVFDLSAHRVKSASAPDGGRVNETHGFPQLH